LVVEILKAVAIGLVQALTEFLPVSSSGHMVVTKALLHVEEVGITIEVVTHFATALAVVIYLRQRIRAILRALVVHAAAPRSGRTAEQGHDLRLLLLVLLGSVPAAVVGLAFRDAIEGLFVDTHMTSIMLIATGVFVFISGRLARPGKHLGWRRAFVVGLAQAAAIVPGVSRSGSTVGTGLLLGVDRRQAFEFSLLLSLPAILGASVIEAVSGRLGGDPIIVVAAAVPAFLGGLVAINLLFRSIVRNKFHVFAYYLIPLGVLLLIVL